MMTQHHFKMKLALSTEQRGDKLTHHFPTILCSLQQCHHCRSDLASVDSLETRRAWRSKSWRRDREASHRPNSDNTFLCTKVQLVLKEFSSYCTGTDVFVLGVTCWTLCSAHTTCNIWAMMRSSPSFKWFQCQRTFQKHTKEKFWIVKEQDVSGNASTLLCIPVSNFKCRGV